MCGIGVCDDISGVFVTMGGRKLGLGFGIRARKITKKFLSFGGFKGVTWHCAEWVFSFVFGCGILRVVQEFHISLLSFSLELRFGAFFAVDCV